MIKNISKLASDEDMSYLVSFIEDNYLTLSKYSFCLKSLTLEDRQEGIVELFSLDNELITDLSSEESNRKLGLSIPGITSYEELLFIFFMSSSIDYSDESNGMIEIVENSWLQDDHKYIIPGYSIGYATVNFVNVKIGRTSVVIVAVVNGNFVTIITSVPGSQISKRTMTISSFMDLMVNITSGNFVNFKRYFPQLLNDDPASKRLMSNVSPGRVLICTNCIQLERHENRNSISVPNMLLSCRRFLIEFVSPIIRKRLVPGEVSEFNKIIQTIDITVSCPGRP